MLDLIPGHAVRKHCKGVSEIDHVIESSAEKVGRTHKTLCRISEKLSEITPLFGRFRYPLKPRNTNIHAGFRDFAGPTIYAIHAPEVECIAKGKARQPYEFGVKTSIAITHRSGLIVGARTFPGNPYDGHILSAQLEQTSILLEGTGKQPEQVFVDLGYRGVDADNPGVEIIHRGKTKALTQEQRRWLKRRQAVEPVIGHLKADHRMNRCWLKGAIGDAINAVLSAAGYNLRWLLRAVAAGKIKGFYFVWILWGLLSGISGPSSVPRRDDLDGGEVRDRKKRLQANLAPLAMVG